MKKILLLFITISVFVMPSQAKFNKENADEKHLQNTIEYLNLNWWENYKDEILINHLKTLYEKNYDLKNAQLKIKRMKNS